MERVAQLITKAKAFRNRAAHNDGTYPFNPLASLLWAVRAALARYPNNSVLPQRLLEEIRSQRFASA